MKIANFSEPCLPMKDSVLSLFGSKLSIITVYIISFFLPKPDKMFATFE